MSVIALTVICCSFSSPHKQQQVLQTAVWSTEEQPCSKMRGQRKQNLKNIRKFLFNGDGHLIMGDHDKKPGVQELPCWDIKQDPRIAPWWATWASGDIRNVLVVRQALNNGFGCFDFAECDESLASPVESVWDSSCSLGLALGSNDSSSSFLLSLEKTSGWW